MVWHLVLLKPRADRTNVDHRALIDAFGTAVTSIPAVRGVRIGRRIMHGAGYEQGMPDTAEFAVVLVFDDVAGLQTYLRHPTHEKLGAEFGQSVTSALIYDFEDFEIGGLEQLSRLP
jgi:hypothetical protein